MFNFLSEQDFRFVKKDQNLLTDKQFIVKEINRFRMSRRRKLMLDGERYYEGKHDILHKTRTVIGVDGELETVDNLPNNKIVDNQYKKMVDQKNNYLLGQPFSIQCDDERYAKILKGIFNRKFQRLMKAVGEDALNCGIGWIFLNYNERGELSPQRFKPHEIIPGWKDAEHTMLDYAIRVYEIIAYEGRQEKTLRKVEVYDEMGITYFELSDGGTLQAVEPYHQPYFTMMEGSEETPYNWFKIPLIPFKYNNKEIPLIRMVKSLQDGINTILSKFQDNMEEDARNTILVLVNYDGENLGSFRRNLSQYGAVKVRSFDGANGDVRTLNVEVNADNYKVILDLFKKALIENAMGYDAKDDRLGGNANQLNIMSMYSDIDLDANSMETEFQAAFEDLLWFVDCHFANIGMGDFESEDITVIFNRDILISESETIENCQKSVGILSKETIVANHPYVDDPQKELDRIERQEQEELRKFDSYEQAFEGKDADEE